MAVVDYGAAKREDKNIKLGRQLTALLTNCRHGGPKYHKYLVSYKLNLQSSILVQQYHKVTNAL